MLLGDPDACITSGRIFIGTSPEIMDGAVNPGDIVLVSNRYEVQMCAIDCGAGAIVVCCGSAVPRTILARAQEKGCIVTQAVNVNFKLDADVKKSMEQACSELGLSMSAAFTVFAKKVGREKRIPFEVSVDPFYSDSNIRYLENIVSDIKDGKAHFAEHDLIEVD